MQTSKSNKSNQHIVLSQQKPQYTGALFESEASFQVASPIPSPSFRDLLRADCLSAFPLPPRPMEPGAHGDAHQLTGNQCQLMLPGKIAEQRSTSRNAAWLAQPS